MHVLYIYAILYAICNYHYTYVSCFDACVYLYIFHECVCYNNQGGALYATAMIICKGGGGGENGQGVHFMPLQ